LPTSRSTARSKPRGWARCRLGARDPSAFWRAADTHERENGNAYREFELALPRELSRDHQLALVERFIERELAANTPISGRCTLIRPAMEAPNRTCM